MIAIEAVTAKGETSALCQSVGLARASLYRRRQPARPAGTVPARRPSPRALVPAERQAILDVLHSERFVDQSPAEVYATLLEEQRYLGSVRTMYRVLAEAHEVRERRAQARHPSYAKPELVATAPNQVWSWDITKLKGPVPYLYYVLYVILDLFSRYVVGWMVAVNESAHLAERLIEQTCAKQGIQPQQLTIHADRGAPMRSKLVALLFSDLGIAASHSRPRVSNDNPFSEAQVPHLQIPTGVSGSIWLPRARAWRQPRSLHVVQQRAPSQRPALSDASRRALWGAPTRCSRFDIVRASPRTPPIPSASSTGPPRPETLPTAVWINPPTHTAVQDAPGTTIVTPDDPATSGDLPATTHQ